MSPSFAQYRTSYIFLFIGLLGATLWTSYYLFGVHYKVLPVGGIGYYRPRPVEEPEQQPWVGFHYSHTAIDIVIPSQVKIIGLVFFGRRDFVTILDCYLKRNLRDNGGLLDEVIFAVNTRNDDDLAYLEELVASHPRYSKYTAKEELEKTYLGQWGAVSDPESIYVKIDDDVVFIEDAAIPAMVKRVLENPQYFAVSANVVNNPALSWVHHSMGVNKLYWPEMEQPRRPPPDSWRASELPSYEGTPEGPPDFNKDGSTPAPYEGHRWLPLRLPADENYDINNSPVSTLTYDAFGPSLKNWAAAAQIHYSFLEHVEQGDLWRYKFDTWDYAYKRLSINFLALRGRDIMDVFPFEGDDEHYLTVARPSQLKRHVIVDGTGMVVHFSFGDQYRAHDGKGVTWTDLLKRYRSYAEEMICPHVTTNTTSGEPLPH